MKRGDRYGIVAAEFSPIEREALAAWRAPLPPDDFCARVVREARETATPVRMGSDYGHSTRTFAPSGGLWRSSAAAAFGLIALVGLWSLEGRRFGGGRSPSAPSESRALWLGGADASDRDSNGRDSNGRDGTDGNADGGARALDEPRERVGASHSGLTVDTTTPRPPNAS